MLAAMYTQDMNFMLPHIETYVEKKTEMPKLVRLHSGLDTQTARFLLLYAGRVS